MAGEWGEGSTSGGRISNEGVFSPQAPFITTSLVMKVRPRYFKACVMLGVGSERAAFEVWLENSGLGMGQEGCPDKWNHLGGRRKRIFFPLSYCISAILFPSPQLGQTSQIIVNCGSNHTAGYSSGWSRTERCQDTGAVRWCWIKRRIIIGWCSLSWEWTTSRSEPNPFQQAGLGWGTISPAFRAQQSCSSQKMK